MRSSPGGHETGPGCHHERTGTECRVHKVLADAAEQHLNNDDAEQGTESAQPQRSCNRNVNAISTPVTRQDRSPTVFG